MPLGTLASTEKDLGRLGRANVGAAREGSGRESWDRKGPEAQRRASSLVAAWAERFESTLLMLGMTAVREVQTRDIHAGVDEFFERLQRIAGGADRANYFQIVGRTLGAAV